MNPEFWKDRSVLVTGHTGFKGAWLSFWLHRLGARVAGYALPPTDPSFFVQAGVERGISSRMGDILDADAVALFFEDRRPEIVFHLAAQSLVRRGYAEPALTYETNVIGTANVLDAVRQLDSVAAVVNVTSDKCYANDGSGRAFKEEDPLGGSDPYSSSKACAELVTRAYVVSYFGTPASPRVATARAGNVLGGGDWGPDRLVPDLMRATIAGEAALIRNPTATRPWQHVLDCLNGYLTLAERLVESDTAVGAWNFGPDGESRPVSWVVEKIEQLWPGRVRVEPISGSPVLEAPTLAVDASRARTLLGWGPRLDLEKTIEWTVEWHRRVEAGEDPGAVAGDQLEHFAHEPAGSDRE